MIYIVTFAFFLDFFWGDPPFLVKMIGHPVIFMGKIIEKTEHFLRKKPISDPGRLRFLGIVLWFSVIFMTVVPCFFLLHFFYELGYFLGFFLEMFLCYQLLATHSLKRESLKVYKALKRGNLAESRLMLSYIVGRETAQLTEEEIAKATVETVAENTTDGIVAPLCFMLCFGGVGGVFYKTMNTLDSMVGYRNEKYDNFGRFSAKMDDVANFLPARLTAFSMLFTSCFTQFNTKEGWRIFWRDRNAHKSPNAGQTESVVAGLFGIELGGDSVYFGKIHEKATLGEKKRPVEPEDIRKTIFLMECTAVVSLLFLLLVSFGVYVFLSH